MSCTGSCGVSDKANGTAWVVEEGYFNSVLSLADKGECLGACPRLTLGQPLLGSRACVQLIAICVWDPWPGPPLPGLYILMGPSSWQALGIA